MIKVRSSAESARAALTDLRGILTVLRDASGTAARAPQPTLGGLEDLIDASRSAGAEVSLAVDGARRPLQQAVEIGTYRIVQESLANAARHAPGAAVVVRLSYGERELGATVTNEAPSSAREKRADDGGHGRVGMRERAVLLGGSLSAHPTPYGGFLVEAHLPTDAASQPAETARAVEQ